MILHPDVQGYIRKNRDENLSQLILKGSPFQHVSAQELAEQINGLKKAEKKIPTWFKTMDIIYPPQLNIEQASSEKTAKYKSRLIRGNKIIDITGGFGVDDYFFAKNFQKVIHCELNASLSEIVQYNFQILKAENISSLTGDGIEILKNSPEIYDWIYIDPSRRDDHGGKVFHLSQCSPNVPEHLELFFEKSDKILIKTSPLLDIKAGIKALKKVIEIHIVAVNDEVKELLWILDRNVSEEIILKTINFKNNKTEIFNAVKDPQNKTSYSLPLKYLYEPNPAIMKSGLFSALAKATNTSKLQVNSHLYTSDELVDFPGRSFQIREVLPFNKKLLRQTLKLKKANIATRNFTDSVKNLRKQLKITDGGNSYLFFTTNLKGKKIVVVCEKN